MIEFSNVYCSFGEKDILKEINFVIKDHLIILGSNGSGKSTLVKAICNLIDYGGDIYIDSKNITSIKQKDLAKQVAYIPTKLDISDEYINVEEYVLLGRYPHKKSFFDYTNVDSEIVKENLSLLGLLDLKEHSVKSLSSGEQQLIQIAQALTQESKTIIFDEPTANLDPKNTLLIAKHIKELKSSHNIIVITHDLEFASSLNIDAIFVKQGGITHYPSSKDFKELVKEYD
jgi:iron complex transport system ATP-binding protein